MDAKKIAERLVYHWDNYDKYKISEMSIDCNEPPDVIVSRAYLSQFTEIEQLLAEVSRLRKLIEDIAGDSAFTGFGDTLQDRIYSEIEK